MEPRQEPFEPTLKDVREAEELVRVVGHRTPVATCASLDRLAGRHLFFKCENLQKIGAFKVRGASNFVFKLPDEVARRGVVTHSSGNHGQAVAVAAGMRRIEARIVMPTTSSPVKRRAIEGYGGIVVDCEPNEAARDATAARLVEETGGTFIPPYNHPDIIAGQGTATLELLEDLPDLDAIVAPVGGGGLMSGTSIAAHGLDPSIRLFGAEPKGADDAWRSLAEGRIVPQTAPRTIADGLLTSLGSLTFPILHRHLERIVTVAEEEIVAAMKLFFERAKLVIEPSAAVAVAAVLSDELRALEGLDRIGVILSGGNVDLDNLPW
jgi:threonine dehydratase/serine racemase